MRVRESYRTFDDQAFYRNRYLSDPQSWPYAERAGFSVNELGKALDIDWESVDGYSRPVIRLAAHIWGFTQGTGKEAHHFNHNSALGLSSAERKAQIQRAHAGSVGSRGSQIGLK